MKTMRISIIAFMLVLCLGLTVHADTYDAYTNTTSNGYTYLSGILDTYSPFETYVLCRTADDEWNLWVGDITYANSTFTMSNCDKYTYRYYNALDTRYGAVIDDYGQSDVLNITDFSYGSVYSNIRGFNDSYGRAQLPLSDFCLVLISITLLMLTVIHWRGRCKQ